MGSCTIPAGQTLTVNGYDIVDDVPGTSNPVLFKTNTTSGPVTYRGVTINGVPYSP